VSILVNIRQYCHPADYAEVRTLWENAGAGIHIRSSDEPDEIEKKLQRDPDLFLVVEDDQRIIGSVVGGFDGRRGMIYHLAVAEEHRQRGLGTALMEEVEQRLRQKGCTRCYLLIATDNIDSMRFYSQRNWEHMDFVAAYAKDLV